MSRNHLARLLADPATVLLVAEGEGELVGFVWAHWLGRLAVERERLYEIEVAPERRRKGLGTHLMRAFPALARSRGADAFLLTNRSNAAALAFHEHLGWRAKNDDDVLPVHP